MEVHLGPPGDASGIEPDITSVAQGFGVDDLENVPNWTRKGEVYRLPFHRRAEVGQSDHPSGDVDGFDRPGSGCEFDLLVRESSGAAHLSHRRQPAEIADGQVVVSHRAARRSDFRRARRRIDPEIELNCGLVENAVVDVGQYPASPARTQS